MSISTIIGLCGNRQPVIKNLCSGGDRQSNINVLFEYSIDVDDWDISSDRFGRFWVCVRVCLCLHRIQSINSAVASMMMMLC